MSDLIEALINDAIHFAQCDGSPEEQGQAEQTMENTAARLRARLAELEGQEPEMVACRACKGSGADETGALPCLECNGLKYTPAAPPPAPSVPDDAEDLAKAFHDAYERWAPEFGYETRAESAVPWEDVPEPNKSLMIAAAGEVLTATPAPPRSESVVKAEALDSRWRVTDTSDEAEAQGIAGALYAAGYEDAHEGRNYHPQKNPVWQKAFGKIFDALRAARLRSEGRE